MSAPATTAQPAGKYAHPWLTPLSPGKTRFYNIAHKSLVTALIAFSAYGFFEVGRGTFYILKHNRDVAVSDFSAAQATSKTEQ